MEYNTLDQKRFMEEINSIIENIGQNEIAIIVKDSFNKSLKAVLISKKNILTNTGHLIVKVGKGTSGFVKDEINQIKLYRKDYISNMLPRIRGASINTKDNAMEMIDYKVRMFKEMSIKDKRGVLLSGILWITTIFLVGGGSDFEGGIPDLDIKTGGIGNHRNPFSHTILVGLSLEFFIRLTINLLRYGREYLPNDRSKIWKCVEGLADIIDKNETVLVSGMWLGLSIHLLKDANIGATRTKPYANMPIEMSMKGHQNMFAGNSFLSFLFGGQSE